MGSAANRRLAIVVRHRLLTPPIDPACQVGGADRLDPRFRYRSALPVTAAVPSPNAGSQYSRP